MDSNDLPFVRTTMTMLSAAGIRTWLFGGWAEELRRVIQPRPHHDVDLLYPASDFRIVDRHLLENDSIEEITLKRFPHKRAFERAGAMVELFLLQGDEDSGYFTDFWGNNRYHWPSGALPNDPVEGLSVASAAAVADYRENFERLASR